MWNKTSILKFERVGLKNFNEYEIFIKYSNEIEDVVMKISMNTIQGKNKKH